MLVMLFLACSAEFPAPTAGDPAPLAGVHPSLTAGLAVRGPQQTGSAGPKEPRDTGDVDDTGLDTAEPDLPWWLDQDGDGFGAGEPIWSPVAVPGFVDQDGDCDDSDLRANPAQRGFFRDPRADGAWDFDCDGVATVGAPWLGACDALCQLADEGWDASEVPPCGEGEAWVSACSGAGADEADGECQPVSSEVRIQACR